MLAGLLTFAHLLAGPGIQAAGEAEFRKHVQPFLTRHCIGCHNTRLKLANLDLQKYNSTSAVLAAQDVWDKAARKIRNREMPPKERPAPSQQEIDRLMAWLNAQYLRYDRTAKLDPGRVTARRLNRAEYNNTIRDLVGLDLRPAEAFPADDSGYGFDNIGDVLSVSPALMEKYLTAAGRIARASIAVPPQYKETSDRYRSDRVKPAGLPGSIEIRHNFPVEADYQLRLGFAGRRATPEDQLQFILYLDGEELQRFDAMTPPNRPRVGDLRIRAPAGRRHLRAQVADLAGKPITEDKGILVEYLDIRGPYDPAPLVPPASHKMLLVCGEWPGNYDEPCLKRMVGEMARRAFRRPVGPAEIERFFRHVALARQDNEPPEQGLRYALQSILVSPHFLFRIEQDRKPNDPKAAYPVDDFELASRLSYFLWSSMPDEPLFELAWNRQLRKPGAIDNQVRRMIADPRFSGFIDNFVGQWLELRNLGEVKPAPEKFPEFDEELRDAMRRETGMYVESVARQDRSILEFLDSNYTFVNQRLARHYGIEGVTGSEHRRVALTNGQRGGLLTHASLLTVSSYPTRTSPVIRGKFLLENFLNAPPPPPPPNVPNLEESGVGVTGSLRQQLERHRTNTVCASCHTRMDALGFGLENYDAIGRWRVMEGKFPVDSSGELPGGRKFSSPAGLRTILLKDKDDFAQCLAEKMLTYALGRGLESYDRPAVRQIVRNVAASGYRFQRLMTEIVKSAPFQMRRAEGGRP